MVGMLNAKGKNLAGANIATVAGAGSSATDAAALVASVNIVTGGNGTVGVILNSATEVGSATFISNEGSGALKVYPHSTGTLNANTATTGYVSVAANKGAMCLRLTDIKWLVVYA